jgi:hypothetical protein
MADTVKRCADEMIGRCTAAIEKIEDAERAEKTAKEERIRKARESVLSIREEKGYEKDEDGKIAHYRYTVTCHSGKTFIFTDRNIFDFGRVINPDYEIAPGRSGGILINDDGRYSWHQYAGGGLRKVRRLEDDELTAYMAVEILGKYAGTRFRMEPGIR